MNNPLICSFCRKHSAEVELLITGPDSITICSECIEVCMEEIYERRQRTSVTAEEIEIELWEQIIADRWEENERGRRI